MNLEDKVKEGLKRTSKHLKSGLINVMLATFLTFMTVQCSYDNKKQNSDNNYNEIKQEQVEIKQEQVDNSKRAIIIVADSTSDHNNAFYWSENKKKAIQTLQQKYNLKTQIDGITKAIRLTKELGYDTYVDTVSTKEEYFNAFKKGYDALNGKFDLYIGMAHGSPGMISLTNNKLIKVSTRTLVIDGNEVEVETYSSNSSLGIVEDKDYLTHNLSIYFKKNAYGIQMSCSSADTSNGQKPFIQYLANSANISIVGLTDPSPAKIELVEDKIELKSVDFSTYSVKIEKNGWKVHPDSSQSGFINYEDKKFFFAKNKEGKIRPFCQEDQDAYKLSDDFIESHIKHIGLKDVIYTVEPEK